MRVSIALLPFAVVILFASGTCGALSTGKRFLRSGENADVNDGNQEVRGVNFSALEKIILGASDFKMVKAVKEAVKKVGPIKDLDGVLSNSDDMFKQFISWEKQGASPSDVFIKLLATDRAGTKEIQLVSQYALFLDDATVKAT
ncbi:hypothetical protein PHYPSEUDO_014977 [Phytophthora pseudosyringae]|uniref:RxLR effector protein n=1 Tax=Phytophthora pseudosyringae TaxID=221518 RepID=A0A8T1V8G4_9STRA|nr:hypothetical protein PHYPSEUDO_014977 [Phytophthora pseudosyringae]